MSITIHPFTKAALDEVDQLVIAAYNVGLSRKDALRRYLDLQPEGAIVAKQNQAIVGFGDVFDYGPFAYLGLMSVHPSTQKQGIGQILLEHLLELLEARHCPTVLLDASPAGAPLYKKYGFVEEDTTVVMRQEHSIMLPHTRPATVFPIQESDLPEIIAFDATHFGANRGTILKAYWDDSPERASLIRNEDGQFSGYIIAQPSVLGPWVALTPHDAEALLLHTLALPLQAHSSCFVSLGHNTALDLLTRYGFVQQRTLSHMRKGKPLQRQRTTTLYGQTSLGLG